MPSDHHSEAHISFMDHLLTQLTLFAKLIPDAFQYRDPKLLHPPLEAVQLFETLNKQLEKEQNNPKANPFLRVTLVWDFERILYSLKAGLLHSNSPCPSSKAIVLDYKGYILTLVTATKNKINRHLEPIFQRLHADLEKEYGEPMAMSIPPYKPWRVWENKRSLLIPLE